MQTECVFLNTQSLYSVDTCPFVLVQYRYSYGSHMSKEMHNSKSPVTRVNEFQPNGSMT